jgi:hypothetical protein
MSFPYHHATAMRFVQRGQLSVSVMARPNALVILYDIKYISSVPQFTGSQILRISTVYLTGFKHFKIRSNQKELQI